MFSKCPTVSLEDRPPRQQETEESVDVLTIKRPHMTRLEITIHQDYIVRGIKSSLLASFVSPEHPPTAAVTDRRDVRRAKGKTD